MSSTEGQVGVNSNLKKQDLENLDITKLTPLSPEVISRQATINIGTIGHVAHGKSTVVKAISGVQTVRFKNELERNITIKLERLSLRKINEITKSREKLREYMRKENRKLQKLQREHDLETFRNSSPMSMSMMSLASSSSSGYGTSIDLPNDFKMPEIVPKKKKKEGVKEYIVESIESMEVHRSEPKAIFFVKWKGYPFSENTWEPYSNLDDCTLLEDFLSKEMDRYKTTIDGIYTNIANEIEAEGYTVNDDDLHVTRVESFDNKAHLADLILLAQFKLSGSKSKLAPAKIRDRVKRDSIIKPYYIRRQQQILEILAWKANINCAEYAANINVENNIDYEIPHILFNYVKECVFGPNIVVSDDPPIGCECEAVCNSRSDCCAKMSGATFAYNAKGRLRISPGMPIFECNKRCKCGPDCVNRQVQRGRKNSLCIFKTSNGCGWGVKTEKPIPEREYVCEYVGEVISTAEADERGKTYDAQGRTYLFDLDYNADAECVYTIDAANYGNVSHFINHSCEPNCGVWPVWVNCLDPMMPRLALFSLRRIEAGEELTFDYINQNSAGRGDNIDQLEYDNVSTAEKVPCRCGSANCRKFLF